MEQQCAAAAIPTAASSACGLAPTAAIAGRSWPVQRAVRSGIAQAETPPATPAITLRTGTTRAWRSIQIIPIAFSLIRTTHGSRLAPAHRCLTKPADIMAAPRQTTLCMWTITLWRLCPALQHSARRQRRRHLRHDQRRHRQLHCPRDLVQHGQWLEHDRVLRRRHQRQLC